jgi:opacity protein-like surface antigen
MIRENTLKTFLLTFIIALSVNSSISAQETTQPVKKQKHRTGSIYFSWGYNTEWYTHSTVHVDQPSLGNHYDLVEVSSHDHKGWDQGLLHEAISIPQYNYRLGYYFNAKQDLGIEINFDHTKYIITDGEYIQFKGTMNNAPYNQRLLFSQNTGFYYYLNNGANFLLFNFVKRVGLYHTDNNYFKLDLTGKAGIGPVIPHVQNEFFGQPNQQHFQLGGWNTGVETAVRATFLKYGYLEFSQKVDYARYSGLKIYDGTVKQNFGCYELILSAGFIIPTTHHNPSF